jgi:membrane protease YdiL (CAAX protease family)
MAMKHGKEIGAFIVLVVLLYIFSVVQSAWNAMSNDLRLALAMVFFVWILNWARKNLGSPRLAILYAIVLAYIVFFKHPEAVWLVAGIIVLAWIGPKFFEGLETSGPKSDPLLSALKEAKPTITFAITPPPGYAYPYYYPSAPGQTGQQGPGKQNP